MQNPLRGEPDVGDPKSSWGWVKALLQSVYDQPDAGAVHAEFDRVVDALAEKLPVIAEHLETVTPPVEPASHGPIRRGPERPDQPMSD